jgi:hypothetical protein
MVSRTLYLSQAYTEYQSKRAQNPSNLAHDLPSTTNDRFFALPELCEQVLQHSNSMGEIFRPRRVCRAWKCLTEESPLLKQHTSLVLANGSHQPEEYWGYPGGFNDLVLTYKRPQDMPEPRDPYIMMIYHEEPDALEALNKNFKDTLGSHKFLAQPPVSRVHATWKFGWAYMEMELNNDLGVRVTDLIEHLEEYGQTRDGAKVVGMELTALFVYCARRQRPDTSRRRSRAERKTRQQPSAWMRWRERLVRGDEAVQAAMDYL